MSFTSKKINIFLLFKLPAVYFTGIRVKSITAKCSVVVVRHRWINQNPFKSIFWAVQGMASELTTGILVMKAIKDSGKNISMLVTKMNAIFTKKATGKVYFKCVEGELIKNAIRKAIETGEGQTITVKSEGVNEKGDLVSSFEYEWSLKLKS